MISLPDFLPFNKMSDRLKFSKEDSDTAYFYDLMLLGEMLLKLICSGIISGIQDDTERHRYRLLHQLVRTDGLGDWSKAIDVALIGPASNHLTPALLIERKELTERLGSGWQYEAVTSIFNCLTRVITVQEKLPSKLQGRKWFQYFVELRNKTKAHGAITASTIVEILPMLEKSIYLVANNFNLFIRPWAYLHRNYSGKYRVTKWTSCTAFDHLKTIRSVEHKTLIDGVYILYDEPCKIDLAYSNIDASDFNLANGCFNGKTFELLSYITDEKIEGDGMLYMTPPSELPSSETQGLGLLDIQEKCFGNIPLLPKNYISRLDLENTLYDLLVDDRHPIITLTGRGGIGKTSLALSVLWRIAKTVRFEALIWFSARDIDLRPEGPKIVKPHILSSKDLVKEFTRLLEPSGHHDKEFDQLKYFTDALTKSPTGAPLLFIFDNFETVNNPVDLFSWIDTYIRIPNKVLITTRHHEFKGDYPVDVSGMNEKECNELVTNITNDLNIKSLITFEYRRELFHQSDGHPYVIKILLGEVAKANKLGSIPKIVANQDEILDALFERTYNSLSPVAKRIFLTLCEWKSVYPKIAIEAVLLRPSVEQMDPEAGIEELRKSSFLEIVESNQNDDLFIVVPLVAAIFGKRKLAVAPDKNIIKEDSLLLQEFGVAQTSDIKHGLQPRIERMFKSVALKIQNEGVIEERLPILEFVARKYPPAWLLLSTLFEETEEILNLEKSKEYLRSYLEFTNGFIIQHKVWKKLAEICRRTNDWHGELNALIERTSYDEAPFNLLSSTLKRLNGMFKDDPRQIDKEDLRSVLNPLLKKFAAHLSEAESEDCSNLAWLYIHTKQIDKAKEYVKHAIQKNPDNPYCEKLISIVHI